MGVTGLPSAPMVRWFGALMSVGEPVNVVISPVSGSTRPIRSLAWLVNQTIPSGPTAMSVGSSKAGKASGPTEASSDSKRILCVPWRTLASWKSMAMSCSTTCAMRTRGALPAAVPGSAGFSSKAGSTRNLPWRLRCIDR